MRRYHEVLINHKFPAPSGTPAKLCLRHKKCGNHMLEENMYDHTRWYYYHNTCIVFINPRLKEITINNGGWDTLSTRTAINGYVCYYYKPGWKIEYASTHVGRKDW